MANSCFLSMNLHRSPWGAGILAGSYKPGSPESPILASLGWELLAGSFVQKLFTLAYFLGRSHCESVHSAGTCLFWPTAVNPYMPKRRLQANCGSLHPHFGRFWGSAQTKNAAAAGAH